jgi:hypothetical protein
MKQANRVYQNQKVSEHLKSSSLLHNIQLEDLSVDQSGLGVSSDEVCVLMEGPRSLTIFLP